MLGFNIAEANERSNTVTTVTMNGHDPAALQRYCKEKCGVVLGTGIGDLSGQAFRIAHMGHVNAPMILGTLGVIEVGAQRAEHSPWQGRNRSRDRISRRERRGVRRHRLLLRGGERYRVIVAKRVTALPTVAH